MTAELVQPTINLQGFAQWQDERRAAHHETWDEFRQQKQKSQCRRLMKAGRHLFDDDTPTEEYGGFFGTAKEMEDMLFETKLDIMENHRHDDRAVMVMLGGLIASGLSYCAHLGCFGSGPIAHVIPDAYQPAASFVPVLTGFVNWMFKAGALGKSNEKKDWLKAQGKAVEDVLPAMQTAIKAMHAGDTLGLKGFEQEAFLLLQMADGDPDLRTKTCAEFCSERNEWLYGEQDDETEEDDRNAAHEQMDQSWTFLQNNWYGIPPLSPGI